MSTASDDGQPGPSLRPFQCQTCSRRFTRLENLKRHRKLHESETEAAIPCTECSATFARNDLRQRHMKRKHADIVGGCNDVESSVACSVSHDNVNRDPSRPPFDFTVPPLADPVMIQANGSNLAQISPERSPSQGLVGNNSVSPVPWANRDFDALFLQLDADSMAPPHEAFSGTDSAHQAPPSAPASPDPLDDQAALMRAAEALSLHATSYFDFIHLPTFAAADRVPRILAAGILCTGLLFSSDHVERLRAPMYYEMGKKIFMNDDAAATSGGSSSEALAYVQALVLLSLYAVMCRCGAETYAGLRMISRCVELARKRGIMEPYNPSQVESSSLGDLWHAAVRAEAHKRTLFSLYNLDAIFYCLISRPRSLSHLEIKHDLPSGPDFWSLGSETAWAHRMLTGSFNQPKTRYIDAVRQSFSGTPGTVQNLDTPSIQLILMFYYTSLREVSGWSTMTGRANLDRFEVLHTALTSIENMATFPQGTHDPAELLCEWTWHTCMVDLCLWSQPHTGGLVEDSLDGALAAAAMLAKTNPVPMPADIVTTLEPHLSWMLLQLDRASADDARQEAPWVLVFAFKALVISWQVLGMRTGHLDRTLYRLEIDGTAGDHGQAGMIAWFRRCIARREVWGLARVIERGLRVLEGP